MSFSEDMNAEQLEHYIRTIDQALFGKDFSEYLFVGADAPFQSKDPVPFVKDIKTQIAPELLKYLVKRQGGMIRTNHVFLISTAGVFMSAQDFMARRPAGKMYIDLLWYSMALKRVWVKVLHMAGGPVKDVFLNADEITSCCNEDIVTRIKAELKDDEEVVGYVQTLLDQEWDAHMELLTPQLDQKPKIQKDWYACCSAEAKVLSRLAMSVGTIEEGIAFLKRCKAVSDSLSQRVA
jgi:hypothetical protein